MNDKTGNAAPTSAVDQPLAPHRVLDEFYSAPAERATVVNQMFDRSAPHYDRISGMLSFGSDRYYRRDVLRRAGLRPGMKLLDVATGTGLVVQAALDLGIPAADIIGLDPSAGMLEENRKLHDVKLIQGYGEKMPFPDKSFDFISMGYALRHVEDLHVLFAEFRRVLKPNGTVVILEISRPRSRFAFFFLKIYMGKVVPFLTKLFTRDRDAARLMEYYWATIADCVAPEVILKALKSSGFDKVELKQTGGVLNDYIGVNK